MIGPDGSTAQIAPDDVVTLHVGNAQRAKYLGGTWTQGALCPSCDSRKLPSAAHTPVVGLWRSRWGGVQSPAHLYPHRSANEAYIGVELVPTSHVDGVEPAGPYERFTLEAYTALKDLIASFRAAYGWDDSRGRVVGHEDVGLLDRHDAGGGWDPGALRNSPYFRWERIA